MLADHPVGVPAVVVEDVLLALGRLARSHLDRLPHVTVVGVTGSVGKTTAKDLLAGLLEDFGPTIAPPGSFNNELGLPLTVLRADENTRFLVLEMGARGGPTSRTCATSPRHRRRRAARGKRSRRRVRQSRGHRRAKAELVRALPATASPC